METWILETKLFYLIMKTFGEVETGDTVYLYDEYTKQITQFFVEAVIIDNNSNNNIFLRGQDFKTNVLIFPYEKSLTEITLGGITLSTDKDHILKIKRDITAETNRGFRKLK